MSPFVKIIILHILPERNEKVHKHRKFE